MRGRQAPGVYADALVEVHAAVDFDDEVNPERRPRGRLLGIHRTGRMTCCNTGQAICSRQVLALSWC